MSYHFLATRDQEKNATSFYDFVNIHCQFNKKNKPEYVYTKVLVFFLISRLG